MGGADVTKDDVTADALQAAREAIEREVETMDKLNDIQLIMFALSAIVLSIEMPLIVQQSLFQALRKRVKLSNHKKRIFQA